MNKIKLRIINGPNLNLLGIREPSIYGSIKFCDYYRENISKYNNNNIELSYTQHNDEGAIINDIHRSLECNISGLIINPGGYSHTSISILDAIKSVNIPTIEVHISNVHNREDYRQTLITAKGCFAVISGCGLFGYNLAIETFINKFKYEK